MIPPPAPGGLWALEMAGGEFCGNAARSFGLLAARLTGLAGRHTVMVKISGAARPLPVQVDTRSSAAAAELPGPIEERVIEFEGRRLPWYIFEGISHVIICGLESDEALVRALIRRVESGPPPPEEAGAALGLMFYDEKKRFMRPVVWVRKTGTLVRESSCGSGSAALGVWALRDLRAGREKIALAQPGGLIEVEAEKKDNRIQRLAIGGQVSLGEPFRYNLPA